MSLGPLYVLLGEVSVRILCPFFNWIVCLPGEESYEFFIYFGDQTLVCGIIGKYIFPYGWFSFHFANIFFSCAEAFYFDEVLFVYSLLYVPCSMGHMGENIAVWNIWDFPVCFPLGMLWLMFKSFMHLEFIFVYGVSWWLKTFLLLMYILDLISLKWILSGFHLALSTLPKMSI